MSKLKEVRWDSGTMGASYYTKEECLAFVRNMGLEVAVDFHGNPILDRLDEDDEESGVDPVQHVVFHKKYWPKWQVQWWVAQQLEKTGRNVIRVRLHGEDKKGYRFLSQSLYDTLTEQGIRALDYSAEYARSPDCTVELELGEESLRESIVLFERREGKNGEVVGDRVLKEARIALDYFGAPKYILDQLKDAVEGMPLHRESILPIDTVGVPEEDMVYVSIGRNKDEDVVVYKGRNINICPIAVDFPVNPHMGIPVVYCNKHGMLGIDKETSFLGEHHAYTHLITENGNPYTGYQTRMSVGFFTTLDCLKQMFYFFTQTPISRTPYGDDIEAAWAAQGVIDEMKELSKK